jgi:acyl-CoA thioesterase
MKPCRPTKENTSNMTTVRLGIAFCTERVEAYSHGFQTISEVRYLPLPAFAGLDWVTGQPAAWQTVPWSQHAESGDLIVGERPAEQAVIEIVGVA